MTAECGLIALFTTVPAAQRTRAFWILFTDLAERLVHLTLWTILALRVKPYDGRPNPGSRHPSS